MRFKLIFALLLTSAFLSAKPPELTPHLTRKKVEEILRAHVSHKKITQELIKRSFANFLEEIDPIKTYLIESEVAAYLSPSDELLNSTLEEYKMDSFEAYQTLYSKMVGAIERRIRLEEKVDKAELPKGVKGSEFKDIGWAKDEDELFDRLLKIRSLQSEVAEKFEGETKEQFMQRVFKRRRSHEQELLQDNLQDRERHFLSLFVKSMSGALDTHTSYFTPSEANQFMMQVQQRLFGIGAQLRDDLNGFTIVKLLDGGPALNCGKLKVGDRIIAVNQEPVVGMDIIEAVDLIRGPKESKVLLTFLRGAENVPEEKFDLEITRDEIVLKESRFESKTEPFGSGVVAHIRLFTFYQDPSSSSASDLKDALEAIKNEHDLKGVVLDLRNNPGGLLPQAVAVTGLFIKKGIVVSIKDSNGKVQHLRNFNEQPVWDGPLVVLTNKASASAAEIVAQTLQDYGRALVVGENTFGKGSYQTFTFDGSSPNRISPQGEYKVTRGMYYTASGKSPQLKGTQVDIEIPGPYYFADVGEKFSKFPLENESIAANFEDDLVDVHPFHRSKLRRTYKSNRQEVLSLYDPYLLTLKENSEKRVQSSENYQNFLKVLQKEDPTEEEIEPFGENDLQLEETFNIVKDLIQIMEVPSKNEPAVAA